MFEEITQNHISIIKKEANLYDYEIILECDFDYISQKDFFNIYLLQNFQQKFSVFSIKTLADEIPSFILDLKNESTEKYYLSIMNAPKLFGIKELDIGLSIGIETIFLFEENLNWFVVANRYFDKLLLFNKNTLS